MYMLIYVLRHWGRCLQLRENRRTKKYLNGFTVNVYISVTVGCLKFATNIWKTVIFTKPRLWAFITFKQ